MTRPGMNPRAAHPFFATICLVLAGCAAKMPAGPREAPAPSASQPVPAAAGPIQEIVPEREILDPGPLETGAAPEYRIGVEDALAITVYGNEDLSATQTVRPDGFIAFPLIGDLKADGLTPDELRGEIVNRLSRFVQDPQVTVIVSAYNSRKVIGVGEVKTPGPFSLVSSVTLLEGIGRAGGITEDADLKGAMLARAGRILPVGFEKLLRHGDFSQNVMLEPGDIIFIPSLSDRRVFILGEVNDPQVVALKHEVSLIESISVAGGLTRDAQPKNVLVIRGGLGDPRILNVNLNSIVEGGDMAQNVLLEPSDIVYVPRSVIANVSEFFVRLRDILAPFVLAHVLVRDSPVVVDR